MNENQKRRDELLSIPADAKPLGEMVRFRGLTHDRLELLLSEGFIEENATQNNSPTVKGFLLFMKNYPEATAHGYAISLRRSDYRVSLEGLHYVGYVSKAMALDFVKLCRSASTFKCEDRYLYSWWD